MSYLAALLSSAPVLDGAMCASEELSGLPPSAWDAGADADLALRRLAIRTCLTACPVLDACRAAHAGLSPSRRPSGIIAGKLYSLAVRARPDANAVAPAGCAAAVAAARDAGAAVIARAGCAAAAAGARDARPAVIARADCAAASAAACCPAAVSFPCVPGCPACLLLMGRAASPGRKGQQQHPGRRPPAPRSAPAHTCRLDHLDPRWPPGPRLTPGSRAAWLELLADHARPDTVIAALAGVTPTTVGTHRRQLESLGAIGVRRGRTSRGHKSEASAAAWRELLADPARTNVAIAELTGVSAVMVGLHRRRLRLAAVLQPEEKRQPEVSHAASL